MLSREKQLDLVVSAVLASDADRIPVVRSRQSMLWSFVNSAFGLFLMSSVVLAGLGKLYSHFLNVNEQRAFERREVMKLASEVALRVAHLEFHAERMFKTGATDEDRYSGGVWLWRVVVGAPEYHASVDEFDHRHFASLVWRLKLFGKTNRSDQAFRVLLDLERESGARESKYDKNVLNARLQILREYRDEIIR